MKQNDIFPELKHSFSHLKICEYNDGTDRGAIQLLYLCNYHSSITWISTFFKCRFAQEATSNIASLNPAPGCLRNTDSEETPFFNRMSCGSTMIRLWALYGTERIRVTKPCALPKWLAAWSAFTFVVPWASNNK